MERIVQIYNDQQLQWQLVAQQILKTNCWCWREFYDENDQLIDLSQHNAILPLTHNHWNGASYVEMTNLVL